MFGRMRSYLANVGTLRCLCEKAEGYALSDQTRKPGAEHFLLAALDLPDGTAQRAFDLIGADPGALRCAIAGQYDDALRALGLRETRVGEPEALPRANGVYDASASGKEFMLGLAADRKRHRPLCGAHVVAIVAAMEHGVAPRALKRMGVDRVALRMAAEQLSSA